MRGVRLLVGSLLVLLVGIAVTVRLVDETPLVLLVTVPLLIAAFFGVLQPLMWAMSRIGLPRPADGARPVGASELERRLLELAGGGSPFRVETLPDRRIVCSWRIADAAWYEFFAKVRLKEDYRLELLPVPGEGQVRALEVIKRVRKRASLTRFEASWFGFRGWTVAQVNKERGWGVKLFPLEAAKLYEIDFSSRLFRAPVLQTIVDAGWEVQPCTWSLFRGI